MSARVPAEQIESIVGVERHATDHYARAVSAERTVYILHPHDCRARYEDLRECPWSLALDRGIDVDKWTEDVPLVVAVRAGELIPWRLGDVGSEQR